MRKSPRLDRRWIAIGIAALVTIGMLVALAFPRRIGRAVVISNLPDASSSCSMGGTSTNGNRLPVAGARQRTTNGRSSCKVVGLVRRGVFGHDDAGQPKPLEHYKLMLAVDPHEASAIEVQFDLAAGNRDDAFLFVRVDREGSILGRHSDAQNSPSTTIAHRAHSTGSAARHAIEIERQSAGWWVFVDGQFLGNAPFVHAAPAAEFRLLAEGGIAWFSDLTFEELEP